MAAPLDTSLETLREPLLVPAGRPRALYATGIGVVSEALLRRLQSAVLRANLACLCGKWYAASSFCVDIWEARGERIHE